MRKKYKKPIKKDSKKNIASIPHKVQQTYLNLLKYLMCRITHVKKAHCVQLVL